MNLLATTEPKKSNWPIRLVVFFSVLTVIGLVPWESILSIQIMNGMLKCVTNSGIGMAGILGLVITLFLFIRRSYNRFSTFAAVVLIFISIPIGCLLILNLILPSFEWKDVAVYRNNGDYIVIQEFDGFVTSSLRNPSIVRTTSPGAMIRKVEEKFELENDDDRFSGKIITFDGKKWANQPISQ